MAVIVIKITVVCSFLIWGICRYLQKY